jgi:RNA polymerase sigma-70 factor (ECF subfamily)
LKHRGPKMTVSDNTFWLTTFEEHGSSILAFLNSRLGRRDLAEDLLQETFVRAMRRGDKLQADGNIKSYLFTTAYHLIVNQSRRRKTTLFSEVSPEEAPRLERVVVDESKSPDNLADLTRFGALLDKELRLLKPDHRTAFEAAVLQQQPYADIARANGWSVEKVKTDVFRARKQVMQRLRAVLTPETEKRR